MKINNLIFFLVFSFINVIAQEKKSKEQVVFNCFFENIFQKEIKGDICKIHFSNKVENEFSKFDFYESCFDKEIEQKLDENSKEAGDMI